MKLPNKHEENLLLFLHHQDITQWIKRVRKHLNIPKQIFYDGVSEKDKQKLIEIWNTEILEKSASVMDSTDFKNSLDKIREDFRKRKIAHKCASELSYKLHLQLPINYLAHSVNNLIDKYNLPKFYDYPIKTYVETGEIKFMNAKSYGIRQNYLNNPQDKTIDIVVYEPLTGRYPKHFLLWRI